MTEQIEWIKNALGLCLSSSTLSREEQALLGKKLESQYMSYSEESRSNIRQLMKEQLELKDYIYVFSYLIRYIEVNDFVQDLLEALLKQDYNWYKGTMFELQAIANVKGQYGLKRALHRKNVDIYEKTLKTKYDYIPIERRNRKRIVIATEHILSTLHAPTKIVLNFAYALQKELGYEVMLIACPSDGGLSEEEWYGAINMNSIEGFKTEPLEVAYKGEVFYGYQINMTIDSIRNYHMMIKLIHEWNPLFVFSMGMVNPIIELAGKFTTLVAMRMAINCPVSEGEILIRLSEVQGEEEEYKNSLTSGQKQIFLEEKIPVIIEKNDIVFTRQELGLPQDKFLIAIVGNRLDSEIDIEFVQIMKDIIEKTQEVVFVFIGEVSKIKEYFLEDVFNERIHYLGYCRNLMGVYSVMNLYLNPKRRGGGYSGVMAIASGVPCITLPDCDVAFNVGDEFVVQNEEYMINTVCRYVEDKKFYMKKKIQAEVNAKRHTEKKMNEWIKYAIEKIIEAMEESNDSI